MSLKRMSVSSRGTCSRTRLTWSTFSGRLNDLKDSLQRLEALLPAHEGLPVFLNSVQEIRQLFLQGLLVLYLDFGFRGRPELHHIAEVVYAPVVAPVHYKVLGYVV